MPRTSQAALNIVALPTATGLRPPASLSGAERTHWVRVVSSVDAKHFLASDLPLLVELVRALAMGDEASENLQRDGHVIGGRPSAWIGIGEKAARRILSLTQKLRMSPQSRSRALMRRETPQPPVSYYNLMGSSSDGEDDPA